MESITHLRRIRSFVRREGRMTVAQTRALTELLPRYTPAYNGDTLDLEASFGRAGERHLEIGFGNGESLLSMALANPQHNYLGIEVHRPGVGNLLLQQEKHAVENIRVICDDATEVLRNQLTDESLDAVYIFFPDPWHKRRHHKRRLVQSAFVALLRRKLKPGGLLHMATDWEDYAMHMLKVMQTAEGFSNQAVAGGFSERPDYRLLTKFEKRGLRLGHGVWDLLYRRDTRDV